MILTTWRDHLRDGYSVQLHDDTKYVQGFLSDEELFHQDERGAKLDLLRRLCQEWYDKFGERWVPIPPPAGHEWTFTRHETIEGEVVTKEIESA